MAKFMAEAAERAASMPKIPPYLISAPEAILRGLMNPETGEWIWPTPADPAPAPEPAPSPAAKIAMSDIIALWIAERRPPIRSQRTYTSKVERLVAFLGHDDATRITDSDMIRYKEHLLKTKLLRKTVASHLDDLRTIFRFAVRNKKIATDLIGGCDLQGETRPAAATPAILRSRPYADPDRSSTGRTINPLDRMALRI
jgi:hypothetical protein